MSEACDFSFLELVRIENDLCGSISLKILMALFSLNVHMACNVIHFNSTHTELNQKLRSLF